MSEHQDIPIPAELDYIMEASRAVAKNQLVDALWIVKKGLRENSGIADQIDVELFIALLRALIVELEIKLEEHSEFPSSKP